MSDEERPPDAPPRPPLTTERFERTAGRLPGDTRVKIVRSRGFWPRPTVDASFQLFWPSSRER